MPSLLNVNHYINLLTLEQQEIKILLLQYKNLRDNFVDLINDVLGENYYNSGMDVYICDEMSCKDLKARMKRGKLC